MKRQLPKSGYTRNVLTLITGTAIAQSIPIAISPILTRLYTPDDFGVLALYMAIVGVLAAAATWRYELAVMLPERDEDADALVVLSAWVSLAVSLLALLMVILFTDFIAHGLGNPAIGPWLFAVPVSILLTGVYNSLNYWLNRRQRYATMSRNRVAQSGVTAGVNLTLGWMKVGVGGLISGNLLGQFLTTVLLGKQFLKKNRAHDDSWLRLKKIRTLAYQYRHHPLHLLPAQWIGAAAGQLPIFIISGVFGATVTGFYSLALRMISMPTSLVANAIGDVYRQQASVAYREKGEFRSLFCKTLLHTLKIAILPFLILYFIAPDLFAFVFGEPWRESGEYVRIITISAFFQFVFTPIDKGALIVGATTYIFLWHLARFVLLGCLAIASNRVEMDVESIIWAIVVIESYLYIVEGAIGYKLSRGRSI